MLTNAIAFLWQLFKFLFLLCVNSILILCICLIAVMLIIGKEERDRWR